MHRTLSLGLAALCLTACAYPKYVSDEYRYIPLTTFAYDNYSFRIFDKPSAGKLVITPSLGNAVSDTVIRNVTFGKYNNAIGQEKIEKAVIAYLAANGRKCQTTGATLLYDPQWEFTYTCEIKYTAYP
ncbi:MAG: hypothetical protein KBA31_09360 [Alphaproteobacteria bacterium]|nr:hypothetical protein [Alphaproteobacteria bacterium]